MGRVVYLLTAKVPGIECHADAGLTRMRKVTFMYFDAVCGLDAWVVGQVAKCSK